MVLYDYWNKAEYFCTIFYSAEIKEKLHYFLSQWGNEGKASHQNSE